MARPGRRGPADGRSVRGVTGDEHQVWVELGIFRHSLFLHPEGGTRTATDGSVQVISAEKGYSVIYAILGPGGPRVSVDLTHLTHEELVEFRKFWDIAFTLAEPVVLARDKEAEDEFARGNDSLTRVHRAVPHVTVRSRAQRAYSEVVQRGLADVLGGGWALIRSIVPARDAGDEVAAEQASPVVAQDDHTSAD